jgi:glutamate-1-semialdehyde 2,1-aminomutase
MVSQITTKNEALYEKAKQVLVAGASGTARIHHILGRPIYFVRGEGSRLFDIDGNEYIDYNISHGASFLGHNHPKIIAAIEKALSMGIICSYETEYQSQLAELICKVIPSAELVRYSNGGSEATMAAIRLARAATGRDKLLKFEGHFHGLHDYVMWNSSEAVQGNFPTYPYVPPQVESGGVPPDIADYIIVIPWNDVQALEQALDEYGDQIAAVICEPVSYNAGCLMPKPGYLQELRRLTTKHGVVLIFDEILSGFRMCAGGAQEYYGVTPDVSTFGKAISAGIPFAVIAGKRELMQHFTPLGTAAHSGTFSGHLFPVLAAIAALEEISQPGFYDPIMANAKRFYTGIDRLLSDHGVVARVQGLGSCFSIHFGVEGEIWNFQDTAAGDREKYREFSRACLSRGVYFQTYAAGLGGADHHQFSAIHSTADINETLNRIESALNDLQWSR